MVIVRFKLIKLIYDDIAFVIIESMVEVWCKPTIFTYLTPTEIICTITMKQFTVYILYTINCLSNYVY